MFKIRNILNGNNLDENFHYSLTPREVAKFNKTKITSRDVQLSFSKNKNELRSFRRYFIFENVVLLNNINSYNNIFVILKLKKK